MSKEEEETMQKILFICLGNICRSPMAEVLMQEKIQQAGLKKEYVVASAATSSWEVGKPPHEGTQQVLRQHGLSCEKKTAVQLTLKDFQTYDYLIGMDESNVNDLLEKAPASLAGKVHLFLDSVEAMKGQDVPDPYYTGDFNQTYRLIDEGTTAWLSKLTK